jgi:hypothetical protein
LALSVLGFRLIFAKHDDDGDDMNQRAEDGSFLVIRELQQLVPEFEKLKGLVCGQDDTCTAPKNARDVSTSISYGNSSIG